ncbi:MAG: N-acetylglucosamine-6-phosphate deacetylase [Bacillota bacterium]
MAEAGSFTVEGPVLLPGGAVRAAAVTAAGERILSVDGPGYIRGPRVQRLPPGHVLIPGLIDLHMHGGEGTDAATASADVWVRLSRYAASRGATTAVPALVSSSEERTLEFLQGAGRMGDDAPGARIAGVHLEGPFLCVERRGAHSPEAIRPPDPAEVRRWIEVAGSHLSMVTLAPEQPGADEVIEMLSAEGITVAAGHTGATFPEMMRAFDLGVSHVVHLFNGMTPIHHRSPGPAAAALLRSGITCELIPDGVHVDVRMIELVTRCKLAEEICLVTDSTAAAGLRDGSYTLGPLRVNVRGGIARCPDGTLAGSTLTPAGVLRAAGRDLGWSLARAILALSTVPARVLGLPAGEIRPGKRADLAVIDAEWNPVATVVGGRLVYGSLEGGRSCDEHREDQAGGDEGRR